MRILLRIRRYTYAVAVLTVVIVLSLCVGRPAADDDNSDATQNEASTADFAAWTARRVDEMGAYSVTMTTDAGPVALQLQEQPVLTWSNPVRMQHRGVLFLWTENGRPQLACCTFPFPKPTIATHEFQSLGDHPITIQSAEAESHTLTPPAAFQALPGAPFPASNRPLRLAQMRKLAGRFSAYVNHVTTAEDKTRLLTQPIYRNPENADVDGALFVLSQGTDPECLVLLEATEERWQYRIARMTAISLTVRLDNNVLKEYEPVWQVSDTSYHSTRIEDQ